MNPRRARRRQGTAHRTLDEQDRSMAKLRIHNLTMSLDGYAAGPEQGVDAPLGVGGERLHQWAFATKAFREHLGMEGGHTGVDHDLAVRDRDGIGATIMGRNMFGPIRGEWPDEEWKGWWGENPPYHVPVFVLTHYPRKSVEMAGGTTFHFVTGGIEDALKRAKEAAGSKDVRIGGGVETVRQYLRAGLVDEMHVAISPILLGSGEHLLSGLDLPALGYQVREQASSQGAMHVVVEKGASRSTNR
jgi:dihydrofolate reductase